jgi:hypothetical protein
MPERTLDRVVQFDARSRAFGIAPLLATEAPRSYTWSCRTHLDQGVEGACVGHAWAHEIAARPVVLPADSALAFGIYHRAQVLDGQPWPEGTSVIAGAKATRERGFISGYRWAFGLGQALAGVSRHGPAVLGLNWYEGMFDTDRDGFLRVTGDVVGGHSLLAVGVNVRLRTVLLHNSWGPSWGMNGKAYMTWDDFGRLLAEDGEVCLPTRTRPGL